MEKMNNVDHSGAAVVLKVNVADKGVFEKRFTFNPDEKVWAAKARVIHEVSGKDPKDIQNYGFFVPPYQGKAGKFMDEGRPLSEYSLPGEDQSLEFMLKRRVYRSISFDENKLTKIHTKANLKKLMDLVEQNNAGQVNQFLEKGLDPNFQDPKSGESPLTTAASMGNSTEVIMFLVNGGAFMDYRNRAGLTAIHKAAAAGKADNIKAFLDLGASPNYRDLKGLTPLYHACLTCKNPRVVELLLSDQSDIGVKDSQGWQEIHQTCRYGHIQHMEQLIYYGADLNAQNDTGNTPLHICSLYNQEDCARVLLYRGAKRDIVNFANQTAEMVALLASNAKLSEFIKNYSEKDVVPHIDKPTYSTRRRNQSKPRPLANSVFLRDSTDTFLICSGDNSQNSSTPSLQSEVSEPLSSADVSPRDDIPQIEVTKGSPTARNYKRSRTMSGGSGSDSSYATDSGDDGPGSPMEDGFAVRWRTYSLSSLNKEDRGTVPRVKEVKGAANMSLSKKPNGKSHHRKRYEAVKDFHPTQAGELSLTEGDIVEVITKGEKGYWQGTVGAEKGWFPAECVLEYKKRKNRSKTSLHKPPSVASSLNKSNTSLDQPVPSSPPSPASPEPRQVILQKVKTGFGFQMRGANAPTVNKLEFKPSGKIPALQYIGEVEAGGEAERSGLKRGDYILEVNGNDVRTASHRHVVSLIRKTGQNLIMKVISIEKCVQDASSSSNTKPPTMTRSNSLPSGIGPPLQNGTTASDGAQKGKKPPPIPSRAPTTSLTARPKTQRQSISDVNFEEPQAMNQDDRVISVPRERISPTDTQWHSPLTGHASLPRRPKSSYGAIIGSTHETNTEETTRWNYRPVEYLDNTGFMTLPSKPITPNSRQKGDNSIVRRRSNSGDRPKSWMPKVLPSTPPTTPPGQRIATAEPARRNSEGKAIGKSNEAKKEKKRRFSFKKKKEKDYIAPVNENQDDEEDNNEVEQNETQTVENLHIEDEDTPPTTLPGLHHKRLSTFKPVTITHHHHIAENEAVSPELSQALQKRKSRIGSDELSSPGVTTPENEHPVTGYPPPPNFTPPHPTQQAPKAKSLEESIRDEMRRRANTAPASNIPMKPRRTFEYKKLSADESTLEEQPSNVLDLELAKAVARRAQKITSKEPEKPSHIYENINNFKEKEESSSSVEEPPTLSIEEKMKKLRLQDEVSPPPIKFKVPAKPPVGSKTRPAGNTAQPVKAPPPKILPKPKKKSSTSEPEQKPHNPREGLTLPLSGNQHMAYQPPPPVLSPEMVATQFLDDVIDEEVKNSNWDTESWIDVNSQPPSPNPDVFLPPPPTSAPPPAPLTNGEQHHAAKKKYVYKITLVTEKPSDGSQPVEHPPVITQIVTASPTSKTRRSASDASDLPPPPPPPPPPADSPEEATTTFSPPVSHTPPNSPPPPLSQEGTPLADIPPPVFETPPAPILSEPPCDVILPPPPVTPDTVPSTPPVAAATTPLPPSPPVSEQPETMITTFESPLPPPPPETIAEPPSPVIVSEQPVEAEKPEDNSTVIIPPPSPLINEDEGKSKEQSLPSPITEGQLPSPTEKEISKAEEPSPSEKEAVKEGVVIAPPSQYTQETHGGVIIPQPVITDTVKNPDTGPVVTDSGEPNVNSTDNTEASDNNKISDVPALISDNNVDGNKNEPPGEPLITTEDKEELAPPKQELSQDLGESSSFRDIPYEKWSCAHVCQWLESLGMSEHKNLFEENDIRGINLNGLKKDDLRELGVKKLGHRMTIANEIISLTSNNNG